MKKYKFFSILCLLVLVNTTVYAIPVSGENFNRVLNAPTNFVWKWGQEYDSIAGDVSNYGEHAIRMGEQSMGTDGTAWYTLDTGCIYGLKDNTLKVGIYYCDWGWFGDGPTVSIFNYDTSGYEVIGADVGNNDQMQWWWSGYINPPDSYVDQGKVKIKVWAEADDDTVLEIVNVTFEGLNGPQFEWDPSSYDFGDWDIDDGPKDAEIKLRNTGDATATGRLEIVGYPVFKIRYPSDDFSVAADNYIWVGFSFDPYQLKYYDATLKIVDSNCNYPEATLEGHGTDECCLLAGTRITLFDGTYKNIEDIRPGDRVLSYDINNCRFTTWRIKMLGDTIKPIYTINNGLISFTDEHPLFIKKSDGQMGWGAADISAAEKYTRVQKPILTIDVGDYLYATEGEWIQIHTIEYNSQPVQCYNIMSFLGRHTYFANGILVFEDNPPFSVWMANHFYLKGYLPWFIETLLEGLT